MKSEIYSILDEVQKKELLPKNRSLVFQTVKKMSKPLILMKANGPVVNPGKYGFEFG
jgi:hypothetical protein